MSLHGYITMKRSTLIFTGLCETVQCDFGGKFKIQAPQVNLSIMPRSKKAFSSKTIPIGKALGDLKSQLTFTLFLYYDSTVQYLTYNFETFITRYTRQLY
jgi:hypothetical protein